MEDSLEKPAARQLTLFTEVRFMCGRYYADEDTLQEIERLVRRLDERLKSRSYKQDILPSQRAAVIHAG